MSKVLNLAGLAKECFAVIFCFWYNQEQHPVTVSLTTMQTITGGTRPAVVQAVHRLEVDGLIVAERTPGKMTTYNVVIPQHVLAEFKSLYPQNKPVKMFNPQEVIPLTSTSHPRIPQNKNNVKCKPDITSLKVKAVGEIRTGGLKEA